MALTNIQVSKAKPQEKAYKLADERGLHLFVATNGSKYWRLKYRYNGKEKQLSFGVYPEVSLAEAREKRDKARKLLSEAIDPGVVKQAAKRSINQPTEDSFQSVALNGIGNFRLSG